MRRPHLGILARARQAPVPSSAATPAPTASAQPPASMLEAYVHGPPSAQAAVDLFAGEWATALPDEVGARAGHLDLFKDPRINWVVEQVGEMKGRRVLELGPLDGGHTCLMTSAGAQVTAVESNTRAYLRCLVYKELVEMANARFLLGDFTSYLEDNEHEWFDMVLASGVLYHHADPCHLLRLIAEVTDRVGIWTHYYDADVVAQRPHLPRVFSADPVTTEFEGRSVRLHRRDYLEVLQNPDFYGGLQDHAMWMELDDLVGVLDDLGFSDVRVGPSEGTDHPNGPACLLYAERT